VAAASANWALRPRRTAPTGPEALTGAERRVATLATEGLSNRQIAQHLFITQPTVETHLRHVFHKLGITSRAELSSLLGDKAPRLRDEDGASRASRRTASRGHRP
jgi:DNA-binding CsgD family transcriptional regulator